MSTLVRTYGTRLLLLIAAAYGTPGVRAAYGWGQARTSLGRALGQVLFEQPLSMGQQQASNLVDPTNGNAPASVVRLWLDQDCDFTALRSGTVVLLQHGPANGDITVTFDEMLLDCNEDLPVYSFDGDDWTGTIPALEYGGFLPVGAAKMLPDYNGPSWGLAPRHDLAFFYEAPSGCWVTGGSYRETCSPGVWVTTQNPVVDCLLCTACNPYDTAHPLTCTQAPATCSDITNVNGQIICNTPPSTCVATGGSCDSSHTCCAGLVCHASGGPGASCYGPSREMLEV
ncbi:TPA: hypothetical protein ACH3X3_005919 [Trebouxia sp. C0006]